MEAAASLAGLLLFTVLVLARALSPGPINRRRAQGAVAAFLLIGVTCAVGFELVEILGPGGLGGLAGLQAPQLRRELTYLSLVALTTVGYGDVTPLSEGARTLATFEGLLGRLYPAIIIGRMVSALPSPRARGSGSAPLRRSRP